MHFITQTHVPYFRWTMQEELEKVGIPSKVIFDSAVGCVVRQQKDLVRWSIAHAPPLHILHVIASVNTYE